MRYESFFQIHIFIDGTAKLLLKTVSAHIASELKFCQVISVNVERTISTYEKNLNNRRHNLTTEHVEQYPIFHVYKSIK